MNLLYQRLDEIGTGGIGTVYRARQTNLNRHVAIKEVRDIFNVFAGVQRDDIVERFTRITQQQAALLHANIVPVIDIDTTGEFPFVVTHFAPNGNLRRLIDSVGRPPVPVAMKYFMQVLHGLNAAHDQGVVHGGVKPENVVLNAAGNAMISDFGMSRVVERESGRGGNQVYVGVGTVAYMSPEQFQNPNVATAQSDIYSLGIMFYEMLTGKVPGRRSPMPSSFYPDIPRRLDDVFDRMSMDDDEDRYQSVDEIIADIYAADDVMALFDKRSGVIFLRDPMEYGEFGVNVTEAAPAIGSYAAASMDSSPRATAASFVTGLLEESSVGELAEDSSEAQEAAFGADADSEPMEGAAPATHATASSTAGDASGSDVLGKLSKYGALFDED